MTSTPEERTTESLQQLRSGEQVYIGQPATYPQRLVESLRSRFASLAAVEEAYLAQIAISGRAEPPHPIIAIRLSEESDLAETMQAAVDAVTAAAKGELVDIVPVGASSLAEMILRDNQPFYRCA